MGREAGDLALYAGIAAGAESIIIPEIETPITYVIDRLRKARERGKKHSIILLAEGVGDGVEYGRQIEQLSSYETRVTVLGHIQRGGSPSAKDRVLASTLGGLAVDLLIARKSEQIVGYRNNELTYQPMTELLHVKRRIDGSMYQLSEYLSY